MDSETNKLIRKREVGLAYYYRQQEAKGKTPTPGVYGTIKLLPEEERKKRKNAQQRARRAKENITLTPEQIEVRKKYQRDLYHKHKQPRPPKEVKEKKEPTPRVRNKEMQRIYSERNRRKKGILPRSVAVVKVKKERKVYVPKVRVPKMTTEERNRRYRERYKQKCIQEGKEYIPMAERVEMRKAKRLSDTKPVKVVRVPKPKAVKVKAVKVVKPVRKATPREPKPKPELLPTLVRDESDYVSVRIDARTVIRVPPGKDVEQVKQRFIAKMLQNSRI